MSTTQNANLVQFAADIDALFGFNSAWTYNLGDDCWEQDGTINIDDHQISKILRQAGLGQADRDLITRFFMSHEKGHHLQEIVSSTRNYGIEHHEMEIEADLFGAWALALQNAVIASGGLIYIIIEFDDANRIAKRLGTALGSKTGNKPHHPWAEQRELALVKGPMLAVSYPSIQDASTRKDFAADVKYVARRMRHGL
jgi:hypothetical protein